MQPHDASHPALDIAPFWADLNDQLIELVDLVPDDRLDWAPDPGEWGCRRLALHIAGGRDHWMANAVRDGEPLPDWRPDATRHELKEHLQRSWERLARFISDPARLNAEYGPPGGDPEYLDPARFTGHYIAYHRFAHDIHHRAGLLDRLAQLGIDVPAERRRRPL